MLVTLPSAHYRYGDLNATQTPLHTMHNGVGRVDLAHQLRRCVLQAPLLLQQTDRMQLEL